MTTRYDITHIAIHQPSPHANLAQRRAELRQALHAALDDALNSLPVHLDTARAQLRLEHYSTDALSRYGNIRWHITHDDHPRTMHDPTPDTHNL